MAFDQQRLLEATRAFDWTRSLRDTLDTLAAPAGRCGIRVGLFLVRNTARASGFAILPLALAVMLAVQADVLVAQQPAASDDRVKPLAPTNHPRLPADLSQLWLVPERGSVTARDTKSFAEAVELMGRSDFAKALPIFSQPALRRGPLGSYATYYTGLSQLRLGRAANARGTFQEVRKQALVGYLAEAAALGEAEADEALGDEQAAVEIYERLATQKTAAPDNLLMHLGSAARAAGDTERASRAFARVFYDYPLSDLAPEAGSELEKLSAMEAMAFGNTRYRLELRRAEQLYAAKWYPQARASFQALRKVATDDDRELVNLRIAECDYFLRHLRDAREGVRPYVEHGSRQAEALFFFAVASRKLGDSASHAKAVSRLVAEFPSESWTEGALNDLATSQITANEDDRADETFRQLYEKFPVGHHSERAAWKIGWWAYKNGRYADATRVFDRAAADFPRSDYRPAWLYWSARAHETLKESALAEARYTLVATDYLNSYYGRLAIGRLNGPGPERRLVVDARPSAASGSGPLLPDAGPVPVVAPPPNEYVIRALLGSQLYDQAIDELRWAQRAGHDSAAVQATLAWTHLQQGRAETGVQQFTLYRAAVNTMRRAYPQFMAAGGEDLPPDLLKVIFPIAYWDLIRKHAAERDLDPYLVAALVAQESTFVPDIRSRSNAVGLMQLIPPTARRYARKVKLRYSSRLVSNPEANIRMGTAYLADLAAEFGDLHLVLAGYNAGERHVRRWSAERQNLGRDEFIEDIPFPETQYYVKKILGTAEDYRRLYGPDAVERETADSMPAVARPASTATGPLAAKKKGPPAPAKKPRHRASS